MATSQFKPTWWKEENHGSAWERVKEAMHRDWEQTKKDLHMGGHELNQDVKDTVKQMAGKEPIPSDVRANQRVIGDWNDVEVPIGYGYGARREFGGDRFSDVEPKLMSEWNTTATSATGRKWDDVKDYVRRGFEYRDDRTSRS